MYDIQVTVFKIRSSNFNQGQFTGAFDSLFRLSRGRSSAFGQVM